MTDARLPERWLTDRRLQRLTPEHRDSYVWALVWSVSNRTDGLIEPEDLALIPNFTPGAPAALINAGLWAALDEGWLIVDFPSTQTTRAEHEILENARAREREKKARQRAKAASSKDSAHSDVPGDSTEGPEAGQHRIGQDRLGQAYKATNYVSENAEKTNGFHSAPDNEFDRECAEYFAAEYEPPMYDADGNPLDDGADR